MATADGSKIWTTRKYILAALGGTLAVTVVVIIVSVILSPGDIRFSIIHVSKANVSAELSFQPQYLNLTIAATNASQKRKTVRYQSIFVGLQRSTARKDTMNARVYERPPAGAYLPRGAPPAIINASVYVFLSFNETLSNRAYVVVVEAQVRFRIGGIPTRLYNIKVSCPHVFFPVEEGSHNSPMPPVDCGA
ncbi:unnamed protein product [Triticum turgidum subsp. durum]|uniref:Late embryogenesis abundant protein LEA-2 subgroup domain-containing protein n=1 Tax=Triticum turgidum subsp. durum TaxID=4567 RepID=A0A9R1AUJ3_TRITD|nr:unnamed protein product [Triticum turgidum subsp. durum]